MSRNKDKELLIRVRADIRQAQAELQKLVKEIQRSGQQSERTARQTRDFSGAVLGAHRAVLSLRTAVASIGLGLFLRDVTRAALSMERIRNGLEAATGSAEAAEREFQFVAAEAERLGLDLETAAQQFAQLAASARGTALEGQGVRDIFSAIAEAATVLNLSTADTEGALRAVQQIISKGVVSAEELRQQLGERLFGAFQIAARSIGVSTQQLDKFLQEGRLVSERFLPRFAAQIRQEFGAQVPRAAQSATAQINRFNTEIFRLKLAFADSGFLTALVDAMRDLSESFSKPGFREGMAAFGKFTGETIRYLVENKEGILAAAAAFASFAATASITSKIPAPPWLKVLIPALTAAAAGTKTYVSVQQAAASLTRAQTDATEQQSAALQNLEADIQAVTRAMEAQRQSGASEQALAKTEAILARLQARRARLLAERELDASEGQQDREGSAGTTPIGVDSEAQRRESIAKTVQALQLEAATTGLTAKQVALYRLELLGASQADLDLAERAIDAQQALAQQNADLEKARAIIERTRTAEERFAAQIEERNRLYLEGKFGVVGSAEAIENWRRAIVEASQEFEAATEDMGDAGQAMFDELILATRGWSRDFADRLLDGERNFGDFAASIIREIERIALTAAFDPLFASVGDFFRGLFPVQTKAEGGLITGPGTATSDSIPALLSNGEYVVRAAAVQHYGKQFLDEINAIRRPKFAAGGLVRPFTAPLRLAHGGPVSVPQSASPSEVKVVIENKGSPKEINQAQVGQTPAGLVVSIVTDDVDRGGPISSKLARTFNLRRVGG